MSLPTHQCALKTDGDGKSSVHDDVPIPNVPEGYALIKTHYAALNPTDWKATLRAGPGHTIGCDFSGTIVSTKGPISKALQEGDRVCGLSHGVKSNNPQSGAFAQYVIAKADVLIKTPDHVSDAEAATYGVGLITTGQGLYQSLGLPLPGESTEGGRVLIYGGSTATGLFAIQMAKLSGLTVATTCSPRNFDLVKRLGADGAFDYKDPNCGAQIREFTQNKCSHAFDCISEGSSGQICADGLTSATGIRYSSLLRGYEDTFPRKAEAQVCRTTVGYTAVGEEFFFRGTVFKPSPEDFEFAKKWMALCEKLRNQGKWKMEPSVQAGGIDGIVSGLERLKKGEVSGEKLVYQIE
ncbi:MAG: hypothetical protein Q9162_005223 [Coniocarpon cinnabarinum]